MRPRGFVLCLYMVLIPRRAVLAGLAVSPLSAPLAATRTAHAAIRAAAPLSRMNLPWWRERFEASQRALAAGPRLLMLGDSITQNYEKHGPAAWQDFAPVWQRFYAPRGAVNLGFKGDTTASLLWRIQQARFVSPAPSQAVMLIGANNFGRVHWNADDTAIGIDACLDALHARLPGIRTVLVSVLPSVRSAWVDAQTIAVNRMLAERFGGSGDVVWLDATRLFLRPDGSTDPAKFYDPMLSPPEPPLHPRPEVMARLSEMIVAKLK
jgi:lysophospholipase L1-like esterase